VPFFPGLVPDLKRQQSKEHIGSVFLPGLLFSDEQPNGVGIPKASTAQTRFGEVLIDERLQGRPHPAPGQDVFGARDERSLLLETGGGMVKAAPLIDADPFLVVNSDNLWIDGPADTIRLLASQWDDSKMDALLLLVPQARALNHRGMGDFHMDRSGRIRRRERSRVAPFVFTGIQMASKRLLRDAPEGPFSTNLLWDRAIEEGRAFGAVHQGLWFDVGTPQSIPMTEAALENA